MAAKTISKVKKVSGAKAAVKKMAARKAASACKIRVTRSPATPANSKAVRRPPQFSAKDLWNADDTAYFKPYFDRL